MRQFRLRTKTKVGDPIGLDVVVLKFALRASNSVLLLHVVRPAEEATVSAAQPARREISDARLRRLTTREIEVLGLLAAGEKTRAIAQQLGIAPLTARNHIRNMFEKLEVHSKTEAVALAYRMRVV